MHAFAALVIAGALAMAATANAAITFRAASSASLADGDITVANGTFAERTTCGSINPSLPAGSAGDLLIAQVVARDNAAAVTMPGWTTLFADNVAGQDYQAMLFYRSATNTAADTNTITQTGTCNHLMARITRFGNVDPSQPLDFDAGNSAYANASSVTTGTQTVNVPNSLLMFASFVADDRPVNQGGTFTQIYDDADNSARDAEISLNYRIESATGTVGPLTFNFNIGGGSSDPNHGVLFAVRPRVLVLNVPAGTVADDVMVASVTVRACSGTSGAACTMAVNAPAGWTLVDAVDQTTGAGTGGFGNRLLVYTRVATGAEPASYTWTFGGTPVHAGAAGGISSFAGVDITSPVIASAGQATPASYNHPAPSVDTGTIADAMLVTTHSVNSSGTWTPPTGMTEAVDISSLAPTNDLGLSLEMSYESLAAAGATGTRTATLSNPPANDTGATHSLALRPAGALVDHFDIDVGAAAASTCSAKNITITARDASNNVLTGYTGTIALTTSDGRGDWSIATANGTLDNGVALPPGDDNGGASYMFVTADNGVITLALTDRHADDLTVSVVDNVIAASLSTSTVVNFRDNAFVVTPDPVQVAGRSQAMSVTLWRRDTSTGNCAIDTGYSGTKSLDAWLTLDASHPAGATPPTIGALTLPAAPPASNPASNNLALSFSNGTATFNLSTTDVGKYALNLRDDTRTHANAVDITGASSTITTRPFALYAGASGNPGASAASGAIFTAAGANFAATVRGVLWQAADDSDNDGVPNAGADFSDNAVAPHYAWATTLSAVAPFTPATGALGALNNGSIAQAAFSGGAAAPANLQYTEVGSFTLQAAATNFLNSAGVNITTSNGIVGRFIPAQFAVITSAITPACGAGGFTYAREPFSGTLTLEAQGASGAVTANFRDGFDKLDPSTDLTFVNNQTSAPYDDALIGFASGQTFSDAPTGRASLNLQFRWDMPLQAPVVTTVQLAGAIGEVTTVAGAPVGIGATDMRFGRLALENSYGSDLLPLSMSMDVEYYFNAATGFVTNGDDACTAVGVARLDLSNAIADPPLGTPSITTNSGPPATTTTVGVSPIAAGAGGLTFSAPGDGGDGYADVSVELTGMDWLRFDWDGDGMYDDNPLARATFGIYKGNPRSIYRRERY